MPKQLTCIALLLFVTLSYAQERKTILGVIKSDENISIGDIHILNKNSYKGTITNPYGQFSIPVMLNDTLVISGIQFYYKEIVVTQEIIKGKRVTIDLLQKINELEEVEVKAHNLLGNLTTDAEKVAEPKSKIDPKALDFSKIDFSKPVINEIDDIDRKKPPPTIGLVDPAYMQGISAGFGFGKYESKESKKLKKIKQQDSIYKEIRFVVSDSFFTEELKIPVERIKSFIDYCRPKGIFELLKSNKTIELIDLLIKEAPEFKKLG